jgi:cytoskeletal protein CcmA (bactofilin family)
LSVQEVQQSKEHRMIFDKKPAGTMDQIASPNIPVPRTVPRNGLPANATIDSTVTVEVNVMTEGDLQIDGRINGNVECTRLTVGAGGQISGDIKANEVIVRGKVKGTVRAARIMLLDSADVAGNIYYDKMSMEEGAHFVGASNFEPGDTTATAASPDPAS